MDTLGIWLPPSSPERVASLSDIQAVDMRFIAEALHPYIFEKLPRLLALPQDQVSWHFNPLCRGCPYETEDCDRAVREGKLGAIPNLQLADVHVLRQLLSAAYPTQRSTDIEDLHSLFQDVDLQKNLENRLPTTMRRAKRILGFPPRRGIATQHSPMIEAARTHEPQVATNYNVALLL
jgi:hypothetical protein